MDTGQLSLTNCTSSTLPVAIFPHPSSNRMALWIGGNSAIWQREVLESAIPIMITAHQQSLSYPRL